MKRKESRSPLRRDSRVVWCLCLCDGLVNHGVPWALVRLIGLLAIAGRIGAGDAPLDCLEFFAGVESIVHGFRSCGLAAYGYERLKDTLCMDILSSLGFIWAIELCFKCRPGGFAHFAPVCSSWVWMSRSSTKRSDCSPMGNEGFHNVSLANKMVSRVVLLILLLHRRGCWVVVEQPSSSFMQCPRSGHAIDFVQSGTWRPCFQTSLARGSHRGARYHKLKDCQLFSNDGFQIRFQRWHHAPPLRYHARFQQLLARVNIYLAKVDLGCFNAETKKLLLLYSNRPWVAELQNHYVTDQPSQGLFVCSQHPDLRLGPP